METLKRIMVEQIRSCSTIMAILLRKNSIYNYRLKWILILGTAILESIAEISLRKIYESG